MQLEHLLRQIKDEAHRQRQAGADEDTAWLRAVVAVIREVAERPDITPFQEAVLKFVYTRSPEAHHAPVTTSAIESSVPLVATRWQAWYNANELKKAGYLYKPGGKHSRKGYKITEAGRALLQEHEAPSLRMITSV